MHGRTLYQRKCDWILCVVVVLALFAATGCGSDSAADDGSRPDADPDGTDVTDVHVGDFGDSGGDGAEDSADDLFPADADGGDTGEVTCIDERCGNGIDDDCDGTVDEGFDDQGAPCTAGEGHCAVAGALVCDPVTGQLACRADGTPGTDEVCNGVDDNCDGTVDEGFSVGEPCTVGALACAASGVTVCSETGGIACNARPLPGLPETCDGTDEDCDGVVDNGCTTCGTLAWSRIDPGSTTSPTAALLPDGTAAFVDGDGYVLVDIGGATVATGELDLGEAPRWLDVAVTGPRTVAGLIAPGGEGESPFAVGVDLETGAVGWRTELGMTDGGAVALAALDGDIVVVGDAAPPSRRPYAWMARLDAESGRVDFFEDLTDIEADVAVSDVTTAPGRAYATVVSATEPGRAWVVATDGAGVRTWQREIVVGEEPVELTSVATRDGRLAVAGSVGLADAHDIWFATLDPTTGAVGRARRIDWGPNERAVALALDSAGHLLVSTDTMVDGDIAARIVRSDPGAGVESWMATHRWSRAGDVIVGRGDRALWTGNHAGPPGARGWSRSFLRPCLADRNSHEVLVYALGGQSNMDGHGAVASLPPGIPAVDPEVELYWPPTGFGSLRPASNARGRFGPEISLGRDLAAALPNQRIMLVKFAIGGTNLFQQWHPGDELDDPTVGPLYPQWTDAVAEAVAQLEAEGASPRIAGLFWMQGESDGGSAGTALAYEANLGRLVRRARDDMDGVSAPFVIGRIFAPTVTFRDIIRTAEQQVVADIHHTVWVDTDDLPLGDPIHYDAHGQLVLGRRFAAAALQMPDEPPPEWPAEIDLGAAAPESAEYEIVRSVALPTSATWHASEDVPYDLDRSEELAGTSFDRMAFFVELAARDRGRAWVWVSIDAPAEDLAAAGVPTALSFQGPIAGLSVRSSDETVAALDGTAAGNIEFWDNCYATGDDGLYDHADVMATPDCYGSMQIHADGVTVFAVNRWAGVGVGIDVGIGSSHLLHPDWTFSQYASAWEERRISFYVRPTPP